MNSTLKLGSSDADVKTLQRLLGITADGIFGKQTEAAVREFQRKNGLVADGIVGRKTWLLLLPSGEPTGTVANQTGTVTGKDINIIDCHINTHITYAPGRAVKYIAIHYTAGSTSKTGTARQTRNVFLQRKASADFVVDDGEIVRINPDLNNYFCWSVGDKKNGYSGGGKLYGVATNRNTISIEICSNLPKGAGTEAAKYANHKGWYFTPSALQNAQRLVKWLMAKYNIPKTNVVRHYDVSGKLCPGVVGWNDAPIYTTDGKATGERNTSAAWNDFLKQI
jgi:hypothetical protein